MDAQVKLSRTNGILPAIAFGLAIAVGMLITSPQRELTAGVVGVSAYLLAIMVNPLAGFLLWTATYPFSSFLFLDIQLGSSIPDLSLSRLCAGALLSVLLAQVAIGRRKLTKRTLLDFVAVLAILGIGLSLSMAEAKTRSAASFVDAYVVPIVLYWVAKNLIRSRADREKVVLAVVIVGAYVAAVAINEQFAGQVLFDTGISAGTYSANVRRISGLLGSPITFGTILGMAFPFAFHYLLYAGRPAVRLLWLLVVLLIIAGLYATAIRTSWIASLLGLILIVIFHPAFRRRQMRIVTTTLVALSVAIAVPFGGAITGAALDNSIIGDRVTSDGPVLARLVLYSTSWQMFRDNPIRGIGYENFRTRYVGYLTAWNEIEAGLGMNADAPHNSFMYVLLSAGLLGFVPYILLFVLIILAVAWSHRREDNLYGSGLFVAFWVGALSYLLNSLTADVVYSPQSSVYFFTLLGAFLAPVVSTTANAKPGGQTT